MGFTNKSLKCLICTNNTCLRGLMKKIVRFTDDNLCSVLKNV